MGEVITLEKDLAAHTREGELYEKLDDCRVLCYACGHRCKILDGRQGICKVRFNVGGVLYVPTGYVAALQLDPIEKKPFFHALPGASALSFGMLGCDYHCSFCQNWDTSQVLRDPEAGRSPEIISAKQIVELALRQKAPIITSTYNEPLITSEWAVEIFRESKKFGLKCSYVSNGNATPEVLDYLQPFVELYKVDLKGFNDKRYRQLGGQLNVVLDTIGMLHEKGFWTEIVTLIVPGFNDSDEELTSIAKFIASISPDIPWHVTAFHQDYKLLEANSTPVKTLLRAVETGRSAGLNFVYAGNIPGHVRNYENTYCPACDELLIERHGYHIVRNSLRDGSCPKCETRIPGVWK
jgi:pyruvate formate lyase activating enzyme